MATDKFVVTGDQYRVIDRRMREIKRQLDQDDGSPLDPRAVAHALQAIIEGRFSEEIFPVTVDYNQSFRDMIKAGRYDLIDSEISEEHFPIDGQGRIETNLVLVHFNRKMSSDAVLKELEQRGLRPGMLPELLAFGAKYPDIQRQFPIIALGSSWTRSLFADCDVPCLKAEVSAGVSKRRLSLAWCGSNWAIYCRFLAVLK